MSIPPGQSHQAVNPSTLHLAPAVDRLHDGTSAMVRLSDTDQAALARLEYMAPDLPPGADERAAEQAYAQLLAAAAGDLTVVDRLGQMQDHLYAAGLSEIHPLANMVLTRFAEAGITPTDAERARFLDLPDPAAADQDARDEEEARRQQAEAITPQEEAFARATFARIGEDYPQGVPPSMILTMAWWHEEATGEHYRALAAAAAGDPSPASTLDDIESHRQALGLPNDAPIVTQARAVARADAQATP